MQKTLQTEHLTLRPVLDEDLPFIFLGLSDPKVVAHYGVSYTTLEETKDQLRFYNELLEKDRGMFWAVCDAKDGAFMGTGGYFRMDRKNRNAELGFWLLPEFWGRSYMAEALREICHYAFKEEGLHRLEAYIETENLACKRALSKLPFEYEGTRRDCEWKHNRWISLEQWAWLDGE